MGCCCSPLHLLLFFKEHQVSPAVCKQKKATHKGTFKSVWGRHRAASNHFWAVLSCIHRWHVLYCALLSWQHWLSEASHFLEGLQLPWLPEQGNARTSRKMQILLFKKCGKWINNKRMGCPLDRICLYLKKIFFWQNRHAEQNGQNYQENGLLRINIILLWLL